MMPFLNLSMVVWPDAQRLPADAPDTFVTLNPVQPPAESKVIRRLSLSHPVYSAESYAAQQQLASVQVCSSGHDHH